MTTNELIVDAPRALSDYDLEGQVGFLLRQAMQRHSMIFASVMGADITPVQWSALVTIVRSGNISQNLLGRTIAVDQATIKGVIDRLHQKQFVKIGPDPDDGRRRLITASVAGCELVASHLGQAIDITNATLAPLSTAEQRQLLSILAKLG